MSLIAATRPEEGLVSRKSTFCFFPFFLVSKLSNSSSAQYNLNCRWVLTFHHPTNLPYTHPDRNSTSDQQDLSRKCSAWKVVQNNFGSKEILGRKNIGPKKFWFKKKLLVKKQFGVQKQFWVLKIWSPKEILGPKDFYIQKYFVKKFRIKRIKVQNSRDIAKMNKCCQDIF